jgi:membrane-anchored protein YejM (alkaline phosphatase superfamily)
VGLWIGTALLLIAAILPSTRTTNIVALVGSTVSTILLLYEIARFVAFRLGYIHGTGQLVAYHQPNTFDHVNQIVGKPMLLVLLISSLASLLISALLTFRFELAHLRSLKARVDKGISGSRCRALPAEILRATFFYILTVIASWKTSAHSTG